MGFGVVCLNWDSGDFVGGFWGFVVAVFGICYWVGVVDASIGPSDCCLGLCARWFLGFG